MFLCDGMLNLLVGTKNEDGVFITTGSKLDLHILTASQLKQQKV